MEVLRPYYPLKNASASPLFRDGILKMLYSCERFSIADLAGCCYVYIPHKATDEGEIMISVVVSEEDCKKGIWNKEYFDGMLPFLAKKRGGFDLVDKLRETARSFREKMESGELESAIDPAFEYRLQSMARKEYEQYVRMHPKKGYSEADALVQTFPSDGEPIPNKTTTVPLEKLPDSGLSKLMMSPSRLLLGLGVMIGSLLLASVVPVLLLGMFYGFIMLTSLVQMKKTKVTKIRNSGFQCQFCCKPTDAVLVEITDVARSFVILFAFIPLILRKRYFLVCSDCLGKYNPADSEIEGLINAETVYYRQITKQEAKALQKNQ